MTGAAAWRGYWVAAPTPFRLDGKLDDEAMRAMYEMYVADGVHGVLVNGTTGEWFSQTPEERRRVAEIAVESVGRAVPVVIGCTTYTPAETIELARHAASIGADGACSTPPPYAHPSTEEIVHFYATITEAVDLPWMVYNWPRGTAVDIDVATCIRLAQLERVVAIKDSTGDELKCARACEAVSGDVAFFGRFIHRVGLAFYRELGGAGNIDGGGLGARYSVPYFEALWAGDLGEARELGARYAALSSSIVNPDYSGKFASPTAQLKAAMRLLAQPGGYVRPPLLELTDPEALRLLGDALADAGLMDREPS